MKIINQWKVLGNMIGLYCLLDKDELIPKPGDFLYDGNVRYPIMSVKARESSGITLEILSINGKIPEKNVEMIENSPKSGTFNLKGSAHQWTIASLRLSGFEITQDVPDFYLVVEPIKDIAELLKNDKRMIIAPSIKASWQDFNAFNMLLQDLSLEAKIDVRNALSVSDSLVEIPLMGGFLKIPPEILIYPIKHNEVSIGYLNAHPVIIYSPEKNVIIASSEAFFIIYDKIYGVGDNSDFITWIIKTNVPKIPKTPKKVSVEAYSEIVIPLGDIEKTSAFNQILYKFSVYGAVVRERDEENNVAYLSTILGDTVFNFKLIIDEKFARILPEKYDALLSGIVRSILMDAIRELQERTKYREKIRTLISLSLELQSTLITLKDAIEAELGEEIITSLLEKAIRISMTNPVFQPLAEEIKKISKNNLKNLEICTIDKWLSLLRELVLKEI